MKHRLILITLLFVVIFSITSCAIAEEPAIKVTLNDEIMVFDQNPIIQNSRVLVPLRKIFESLNAAVSWDPETRTITAIKDGNTVKLTVGLSEAYINGLPITLDQPPVIVNDRTLVPVRFVSEALGADVEWDPETQTVHILSKKVEGVSCSSLGMVPDDETKGSSNYRILITEAKKGTKINVDGTYYLKSTFSGSVSGNEVKTGLYLTGESPVTSKLILGGSTYFNIQGSAVIENISIEGPSDAGSHLIRMKAPFVNEITIRNNYITGNVRLVGSDVPADFNYASNTCYVKKLVVDNNDFYDVYSSSGAPNIINLNNTPVKSSYITNNKVTNFSYIFYANAITNSLSESMRLYLVGNTNAVIENNIVTCTDDYDAKAKNPGVNAMYYCFAQIEGFRVECKGNTFEGIHIFDAPKTGVYDNYLSVTQLLYEGNTWKNNANFTPDFPYVDIMKSMHATSVKRAKIERNYRNNKYIVEPGYADRFGKDRFMLRKQLHTYLEVPNILIIEDNYFDMYILSSGYTNQKFRELFRFNRNTILMDTVEHSIGEQAWAYVNVMKDESGNFIPRNLIFTNNTITCDRAPFGKGIGTMPYYIINDIAGSGDKTVVDFSNNNINVPGLESTPIVTYNARDCSTIIKLTNNIINGKSVAE